MIKVLLQRVRVEYVEILMEGDLRTDRLSEINNSLFSGADPETLNIGPKASPELYPPQEGWTAVKTSLER